MYRKYLKNIAYASFAVWLILNPAAVPQARDAINITDKQPTETVTLSAGKGDVVQVSGNVADIMVSDPSIVEVGPVKNNQLYLIGLRIGDTNVLVFDKDGTLIKQIAVHVKASTSKLESNIKQLFPNEKISVDAIGDRITLSGTVSSADVAARARDIASRFVTNQQTVINNLTVTGNQQVMIHVKIVEVSRNVLNELGLATDIAGVSSGNFNFGHTTGSGAANSFGLTVDPSFGNGSLVYSSGGTGPIQLMIHALERDGMVNTLAQPNLTAISGENARFLAGGEFPIPSQRDNNGNITYEYRPFGISLAFKPIVLDKNRINLQISTEVSEVSSELTLQLPGISVPSFTVRRAETTVEMASGGSLMIAGLIESQAIERMNGLPGISSVPVLGALVRSESFNRNESELLVIISAYLVEPFAEKAAVRAAINDPKRVEPLNRALAESLAISYGQTVNTYAQNRPFGYIME